MTVALQSSKQILRSIFGRSNSEHDTDRSNFPFEVASGRLHALHWHTWRFNWKFASTNNDPCKKLFLLNRCEKHKSDYEKKFGSILSIWCRFDGAITKRSRRLWGWKSLKVFQFICFSLSRRGQNCFSLHQSIARATNRDSLKPADTKNCKNSIFILHKALEVRWNFFILFLFFCRCENHPTSVECKLKVNENC
jgi:hypothetical protein